jgi:SET domain-containing protein
METRSFEVLRSPIRGKGVFATRAFEKGARICVFRGKRMSIGVLKRKYALKLERIDNPLQIGLRTYLDLDEPFVFVNHSCDPNAAMVKSHTLIARRRIRRGEEITYDYSLTTWSDDVAWGRAWTGQWWMHCRCGSRKCRRIVREFPKLSSKLRKDAVAKGLVQDFVAKRAKREKLA